jgi:hypothetical protein
MSQVFNDIFFVIYILYYVNQISDLEVHVGLINWEGESTFFFSNVVQVASKLWYEL